MTAHRKATDDWIERMVEQAVLRSLPDLRNAEKATADHRQIPRLDLRDADRLATKRQWRDDYDRRERRKERWGTAACWLVFIAFNALLFLIAWKTGIVFDGCGPGPCAS
jgi:hypothetical protein